MEKADPGLCASANYCTPGGVQKRPAVGKTKTPNAQMLFAGGAATRGLGVTRGVVCSAHPRAGLHGFGLYRHVGWGLLLLEEGHFILRLDPSVLRFRWRAHYSSTATECRQRVSPCL